MKPAGGAEILSRLCNIGEIEVRRLPRRRRAPSAMASGSGEGGLGSQRDFMDVGLRQGMLGYHLRGADSDKVDG